MSPKNEHKKEMNAQIISQLIPTMKRKNQEEEKVDKKEKVDQWTRMEAAKDEMKKLFSRYPSSKRDSSTFWHEYESLRIKFENAADGSQTSEDRHEVHDVKDAWAAVAVINCCHTINPITIENLEQAWSKIDLNKCHWYETIERQARSLELAALFYDKPSSVICYEEMQKMCDFRTALLAWFKRMYDHYTSIVKPFYDDSFQTQYLDTLERILRTELGDGDLTKIRDEIYETYDNFDTPWVDNLCKTPYNPHVNWIKVWENLSVEQKIEQMRIKAKPIQNYTKCLCVLEH